MTDKGYSNRLKDLFAHQDRYSESELHLLRYGRHFRINADAKIIVGRTKEDNEQMERYLDPAVDVVLKNRSYPGPLVVIPNGAVRDTILLAASVCAGYSKAPADTPVQVKVISSKGRENVTVLPIAPKDVGKYLI